MTAWDLNKLGPPAPELAPCGVAWATEEEFSSWTIPNEGGVAKEEKVMLPTGPSVSFESLTGPEGLISSGVYLSGTCADGHWHRYLLTNGVWVEKRSERNL
jgi:hypothetical protein